MRARFHLDHFEEWLIHHKARQLVGKAGITPSLLDDLKQDLRTETIDRLSDFDPAKSSRHTFVAMVVEHKTASILEHRSAAMRDTQREECSLNASVRDTEGHSVERHQTMSDDQPGRPVGELRELEDDVRGIVAGLPDHLQQVCLRLLQGKSIKDAAEELQIPRTTLYRDIRLLRSAFEEAGLDGYLFEK